MFSLVGSQHGTIPASNFFPLESATVIRADHTSVDTCARKFRRPGRRLQRQQISIAVVNESSYPPITFKRLIPPPPPPRRATRPHARTYIPGTSNRATRRSPRPINDSAARARTTLSHFHRCSSGLHYHRSIQRTWICTAPPPSLSSAAPPPRPRCTRPLPTQS